MESTKQFVKFDESKLKENNLEEKMGGSFYDIGVYPLCYSNLIANSEIQSLEFNVQKYKHYDCDFDCTCEIVYENDKPVYIATAKVESNARYPIALGARATTPTFEQIRPFVMKTLPNDGFVLGEIIGTEVSDIPSEYKSLVAMYDNGIYEQSAIPFVFNYKKMIESPHIGLFGGSGSGKTVAMKVLIEELMKQNMPSIVFDPHFEMNFAENNKIVNNVPINILI